MEKLLTGLFDFQRFAQNPKLQSLIDEVEEKYAVAELTEGELGLLSAAGDPFSRLPAGQDRDRSP